MPIGEFIGEIVLRAVFETVFYGLSYCTGFVFLKTVSFGSIRLAPLAMIGEKNRSKRKWWQTDWSVWIHRPLHGRVFKAEYTCLIGVLIWIAVGVAVYFANRIHSI